MKEQTNVDTFIYTSLLYEIQPKLRIIGFPSMAQEKS